MWHGDPIFENQPCGFSRRLLPEVIFSAIFPPPLLLSHWNYCRLTLFFLANVHVCLQHHVFCVCSGILSSLTTMLFPFIEKTFTLLVVS